MPSLKIGAERDLALGSSRYSASVARRIVSEINGYPAAEEYGRLLKSHASRLDPMVFARDPFVLCTGGESCLRSIPKGKPDGSQMEALRRKNRALNKINQALMKRHEHLIDAVDNPLRHAMQDGMRSLRRVDQRFLHYL